MKEKNENKLNEEIVEEKVEASNNEKLEIKDEEIVKEVVEDNDKYIKLTPKRFYTTIIITSSLVFIILVGIVFGGTYAYQNYQIEAQVNEMIDNALANSNSGTSVDSKVEDGMIAVIDYVGKVNGKTFDGGSGENYSLVIGSNTFVDGFEQQLIGHSKGDKVNVKVTFPEDYQQADLAGKPAVFSVTINDVQQKTDAKLNDAFVQSLGIPDVTTVDGLKQYLRDYIKSQGTN